MAVGVPRELRAKPLGFLLRRGMPGPYAEEAATVGGGGELSIVRDGASTKKPDRKLQRAPTGQQGCDAPSPRRGIRVGGGLCLAANQTLQFGIAPGRAGIEIARTIRASEGGLDVISLQGGMIGSAPEASAAISPIGLGFNRPVGSDRSGVDVPRVHHSDQR